ncbi:hypothetical protein GCM10012275_45300 [Longimycelium tulufanense]|uniref:UPF0145 protein GCM10012275_45300 n=2 Tax=Longimycelium tulufanense TaxID=907463 RepID=A0A8J3CF35_9PSEU|nr:hypothetical protein GCM10012275_45300 [Longimycelium tulufanense]
MPQQQPFPILVSTMNDLPGYRVAHVFGEVFGLTVRSRNMFSNLGASFKALAGGEITQYTQMLAESRNEAVGRLCQSAVAMGANAVLAMRFDCNEIAGTMSEVAAYGTAVYVVPANQPPAPQQAAQVAPQQAGAHQTGPQAAQPQAGQYHPQQVPQG